MDADGEASCRYATRPFFGRATPRLRGFSHSKPKALYRKFVETSGTVEIREDGRITVTLDRRSHNPILREANLAHDQPRIPWLKNHQLEFAYN